LYNLGGDRFNTNNINSVFTGGNNGLDNFSLPGGCGTLTSIPAGFDAPDCDFKVATPDGTLSAGCRCDGPRSRRQKELQIKERYKVQLRWDMQNVFKRYNFNAPTRSVDFRNLRNSKGFERSHDGFPRRAAVNEPDADGSVLVSPNGTGSRESRVRPNLSIFSRMEVRS